MIFYPGMANYIANSPGVKILLPHGTSPLFNSLVAFWKLDEASGNAADSVGANTLTDTNTVTSSTGLVYPTARSFSRASAEYFTIADNAALSTGDVIFWFACWFTLATDTSTNQILAAKDASSTNREYRFFMNFASANTYKAANLIMVNGGANGQVVDTVTIGSGSTWHFYIAWHDSVGNQLGVQLDNNAAVTGSYSSGAADSTAAFRLGMIEEVADHWYLNGLMGPAMFGKGYVPTAADRTFLYNSGAGRTLEQMKDY